MSDGTARMRGAARAKPRSTRGRLVMNWFLEHRRRSRSLAIGKSRVATRVAGALLIRSHELHQRSASYSGMRATNPVPESEFEPTVGKDWRTIQSSAKTFAQPLRRCLPLIPGGPTPGDFFGTSATFFRRAAGAGGEA